MVFSIDGYDGTGKTTLARKLSEKLNYNYLEKPFILKYQIENNCSYEEAKEKTGEIEKQLFKNGDKRKIASYYLEALKWVSNTFNIRDTILDRGLLTTYAVVGDNQTRDIFEDYINFGAFLDGSIYLIADDLERRKRIYLNDPNDPDLKYPIKWRINDLESFADTMKLNYYKIDTNNKNINEVFEEALKIVNESILCGYNKVLKK